MNYFIEKWIGVYLKCFINLILCHRNVYPKSSFTYTTYQGFNLPQYLPITRHHGLNSYIEEFISDLLGKLDHVYHLSLFVISKHNGWAIERYVLDFGQFQHGQPVDKDIVLKEGEVYDEFRSSLNSLITYLEKQTPIRDDTVTFEFVIDTIEMALGRKFGIDMDPKTSKSQVVDFERDTNWIRYHEDQNVPDGKEHSGAYKPKLKVTALIGCDWGPICIQQYNERLIVPNKGLSQVYYDDDQTNNFELTLGSLQ